MMIKHYFFVAVLLLSTNVNSEEFIVFDSTLYKSDSYGRTWGIPDSLEYGMRIVETAYGGDIWLHEVKLIEQPPREEIVRQSAKRLRGKFGELEEVILCLDIESWPLNIKNSKELQENIKKYTRTVTLYKEQFPDVQLGLYAMLPIRNYYDSLKQPSSKDYQTWHERNRELVAIAEKVDIIFPSLYTFTSNQDDWVKYAIENIREAKKYGKPVYPYLWPQYHVSSRNKLEYISSEFWELQLNTVKEHADGVVIWGGWDHENNRQFEWDNEAGWWLTLKRFINNIELSE